MSTPAEYSHREVFLSETSDATPVIILVDNATKDPGLVVIIQDAVEAGASFLIAARTAEALAYARNVAQTVILLTPPAGQARH